MGLQPLFLTPKHTARGQHNNNADWQLQAITGIDPTALSRITHLYHG